MTENAKSSFNWQEPGINWNDIRREHLVQWYDDDGFLVQAVGAFVAAGLRRAQAAITIGTKTHLAALHRWLEADGFAVDDLQREGRFISLDAAETLARFMVDGHPDRKKFREVIGGVVSRATASWTGLRAFGEMVALLWEEGNKAGALELEALWNELGKTYPFALFCAYPKRAFKTVEDRESFAQVCDAHSTVLL